MRLKRPVYGSTVFLLLALILIGCSEVILSPDRSYRFIVTFDRESDLPSILDRLEADGIRAIDVLEIVHGISCHLNEEQMQLVKGLPSVRYIEPDLRLFMLEADPPGAPLIGIYQASRTVESIDWGVKRVKAPEVWETTTGRDVRVGIVDTGIASMHPDLQGAVMGGFNAIDGGSWQDDNNHGTYVASVLAARRNGIGIIGVAPEAMLYAIKVMSSDGSGYVSDVIQGCQWALAQKIPIVNMSLGSDYHSTALRETMSIAASQGMSIIAASGNDGARGVMSPAREDVAVCVGASGTDDKRMSWSNYGPAMRSNGILAPGSWIMAGTKDGQWRRVSGTSIATPHVTGIFALLLQAKHSERESLRRFLFQSTSRPDNPDEFAGYGIVNARGALDAIVGSGPVTSGDGL